MATRMNWNWVMGVQVIVFSTYTENNHYNVKIMISEKNIPNNPLTTPRSAPWKIKEGFCKSHEEAANRAFVYCKKYFIKFGNPFQKEV